VWAFVSMMWETEVNFSTTVCAWNVLVKEGLQIIRDCCNNKRFVCVLFGLVCLILLLSQVHALNLSFYDYEA